MNTSFQVKRILNRTIAVVIALLLSNLLVAINAVGAEAEEYPQLVSRSVTNEVANQSVDSLGYGWGMQISDNGRYVMFASRASNLGGQRQGALALYVKDTVNNEVKLASVNSAGQQENGIVVTARLSGDGRKVAFSTSATNMDERVPSGLRGIYVHDLDSGTTTLASVDSQGVFLSVREYIDISYDGLTVVFAGSSGSSPAETEYDVYARNLSSETTFKVQDERPAAPRISGNGRYVLFDNLVNGKLQVFRYDLITSEVVAVSVTSTNELGNNNSGADYDLSFDGRYIIFKSTATNLYNTPPSSSCEAPRVVFRDIQTGTSRAVDVNESGNFPQGCGTSSVLSISSDGSRVGFISDVGDLTNEDSSGEHGYVRDMVTNITKLVTKNKRGEVADGYTTGLDVSSSGRIAYLTFSSNYDVSPLGQVFLTTYDYAYPVDDVEPSGSFTGSSLVLRLLGQTVSGTSADTTSGVARITLAAGSTALSSDANGGLTLNCNAGRTSCTWSAVANILPLGINNFTLTVTDAAGNVFTSTRQYTVL